MEQMSDPLLLNPAAGGHSNAQAGPRDREDVHDFRGSFPEGFGKGIGMVGRVSLSQWHSFSGNWPFLSGRFLGRNMKISLQDSSTKRHVVSAADLELPPNEKGISEYSEFFPHGLCDYQAKPYLLMPVSAAREQFQSHKETAGALFQSRHQKEKALCSP